MMVLALMLVLVAAHAAHYCAQEPSSSAPSPSTLSLEQVADHDDQPSPSTPAPAPSTLSPQDGDAGDCGKNCADKCHIEKCIPKHYKICIALCKLHCEHPLSYDIYHCTSACAASMSATKLGSGTC